MSIGCALINLQNEIQFDFDLRERALESHNNRVAGLQGEIMTLRREIEKLQAEFRPVKKPKKCKKAAK